MGHADVSTTMIYVHHVPQHDAAARLTEAFASDSIVATPAPTSDAATHKSGK
jgi:hypothetical protein